MIGFIVALQKEAEYFLKNIKNIKTSYLAGKKFFVGEFLDTDVAVIISDIGKVSAALSTQAIIDTVKPELLVNFGTAGGINNLVEVCKFYFIEESIQIDLDLSDIDDVPIGYNQGYKKIFFPSSKIKIDLPSKKLASADRFICKQNDIEIIKENGCAIYDMECAAIAQVAYSNNVPYISIKGISDIFGTKSNKTQFLENTSKINALFPNVIEKTIQNYITGK